MEFQQLKYFLTVAEEGNLTRASRVLHTVQSNTTAKIQQLERELGHSLFIRTKKGMTLTERGLSLITYARSILEIENNIKKEMESKLEPKGSLSIGSLDTFIRIYLKGIIPQFVQSYPEVELAISTGFNLILLQRLRNGEIDLAGVVGEMESKEFEIVFQKKEKMVLLASTKIEDKHPLLILGPDCFFGQTLREYFHHSRKVLHISSIESILTCVASGIGVTLLPKTLIPTQYQYLIHKNIKESCSYQLIRKKKRPKSINEKNFVDLVQARP
ncbi:MAG: LysR family transcriptional regulator [Spirochaetota bacterium]